MNSSSAIQPVTNTHIDSLSTLSREYKTKVRKILCHSIEKCNEENSKKKYSKFDSGYIDYLSHYATWLETCSQHSISLSEQYQLGKGWKEIEVINVPAIEEFFTKFVAKRLRTRNKTAQKHITCLQNFATYIEKKNIAIHELLEVKSGIATHSEVRKEAQTKNAHEFDPHDDIPERVISREDENKLINLALDYSSNKILDFSQSMLFLTTFTSTTQRLIRCESLLRHNYPDFYATSSKGPHRK